MQLIGPLRWSTNLFNEHFPRIFRYCNRTWPTVRRYSSSVPMKMLTGRCWAFAQTIQIGICIRTTCRSHRRAQPSKTSKLNWGIEASFIIIFLVALKSNYVIKWVCMFQLVLGHSAQRAVWELMPEYIAERRYKACLCCKNNHIFFSLLYKSQLFSHFFLNRDVRMRFEAACLRLMTNLYLIPTLLLWNDEQQMVREDEYSGNPFLFLN